MGFSLALVSPPPLSDLLSGASASGPLALFLDFDGTLVDLAPAPDAIRPVADLAKRLTTLSQRLDGRIAIVSGRGIADIEGHVGALQIAMAGSHGSDMRSAAGETIGKGASGLPAAIENALREFAGKEGVRYEHKPHGGALHYRQNPDRGPRVNAFAEQVAAEHGWAVQYGKCVAEIVAKGASKGDAVNLFMKEAPFAGSRPFFIGDDLTDEAGFRACRDDGGAGILVGNRDTTDAQYQLSNVAAVHAWLEL